MSGFESKGIGSSEKSEKESSELNGKDPCESLKLKSGVKKVSWTRTAYMHVRHQKLMKQAPAPKTSLFKKLYFYFTGVKSGGQRCLETLIWQNGGIVCRDSLRTVITHAITENLSSSKMEKELSSVLRNRSSIIFVSPKWLLKCIERKSLLATWPFQIVKAPPDMKTIDTFFRRSKRINKDILGCEVQKTTANTKSQTDER